MKILVFSDSHGNTANMKLAVEREKPDRIFHLGDVARDAAALADLFPNIPLEGVCGNCDGYCDVPKLLVLTAGGKRFMLTHGHLYHVKLGIGGAVEAAREAGVDALLFGHTHEALCTESQGFWVMNPGSIRGPWQASYGVIVLGNDGMICYLEEME